MKCEQNGEKKATTPKIIFLQRKKFNTFLFCVLTVVVLFVLEGITFSNHDTLRIFCFFLKSLGVMVRFLLRNWVW